MTANNGRRGGRRRGEDGTVVIMTAIAMLGTLLAMGLAIDVSRIYAVRSDLQNAADAAALAAARELNSGSEGIHDAVERANAVANSYGTERSPVTIETVEFAVNLDDETYLSEADAAADPDDIRFVRVTTQSVNVSILFAVAALGATHVETGAATAGMSVGLNTICNIYPIAIAKDDPTTGFTAGVSMALTFRDSTGTSGIVLAERDYVVLDMEKQGTGAKETKLAAAGVSPVCIKLGDEIWFSKSQSANSMNGPMQMEEGANTRFDTYKNENDNFINPTTAPPDENVAEDISWAQYKSGSPFTQPTHTGEEDRRIIVTPIIRVKPSPGYVGSPPTGIVEGFRAFLMRRKIDGKCDNSHKNSKFHCPAGTSAAGDILVEQLDDDYVIGLGFYDPSAASTSFTIPVLYR